MAKNKNSETLNSVLSEKVDSDILAKLDNLRLFGVPDDLVKEFHQRLVGIIGENPNASEVIAGELEKTTLSVEDLFARYNRQFRSVLDAGSMDESFIQAANDEEYSTNQRQKNLDISINWDDNSNVVDFTAYNTTSFKDPLYGIENEEEDDDEDGDDQQKAA